MATIKTVLVKGRGNRSGKFPLVIQVLHKRKKKVVYTGFNILESLFDSVDGKVIAGEGNCLDTVRHINRKCRAISRVLIKSVSIVEKNRYNPR